MLAREVAASVLDDDDGDDEELRFFDDRDGGDVRAYAPDSVAHAQRTARERSELVHMLLESIASVPVAIARIHENEKLLVALQQQMGGEQHALLRRFLESDGVTEGGEDAFEDDDDSHNDDGGGSFNGNELEDVDDSDSDSAESSGFGSDYERDLADAVNQLVMTDDTLAAAMHHHQLLSAPIAIASGGDSEQLADEAQRASGSSPHSSIALGASPGTLSQDGEPVSALWPRQPHQFAFTQEEEAAVRGEDEVYSEIISSMCEDESLHGDDDDEDEEDDDNGGNDDILEGDEEYDETDKVFEMDEDDSVMDAYISGYRAGRAFEADSGLNAPADASGVGEQNEDDDDLDASDDEYEPEYEVVELRIIREKLKTGFEPSRDWRPRVGSLVGGRYKVELAIGEAVFSRTYKCVDTSSNRSVCLKIIKNNKEYFDQGVDEIRLLQYIASQCDVDAKHLVRLLDFFYFREHLIIVTELLRDNLYEFSKLLLARGVLNYFNMARLKTVAADVLEALEALHTLGIVHCDLKPENVLVSSFRECRVKVIDFGSACFVTDELTSYVQSRSYRAPEVILGLAYDQKIDLWSLGCVLAELFTGEVLFHNDSEQTLLARIIAAVGPVPATLLAEREDIRDQFCANELFEVDASGAGVVVGSLRLPALEDVVQTGDRLFLDFLRCLLRIDPTERLSAAQALAHPWLAG